MGWLANIPGIEAGNHHRGFLGGWPGGEFEGKDAVVFAGNLFEKGDELMLPFLL